MLRVHNVACRKARLQQHSRTAFISQPNCIVMITSTSLSPWNLREEVLTVRCFTTAMPKEEDGAVSSSDSSTTTDWRKLSKQQQPPTSSIASTFARRSNNNNNGIHSKMNGGSVMEFFNRRSETRAAGAASTTTTATNPQPAVDRRENPMGGLPRPTLTNFSEPPTQPPPSFRGLSSSSPQQPGNASRRPPSWDQRSAAPFGNANNNNHPNNLSRTPPPNFNSRQDGQNQFQGRAANPSSSPWSSNNMQQQQRPAANPFFQNPSNQNSNASRFSSPPRQQQPPRHPQSSHPGRPAEEFLSLLKNTSPPQQNTGSLRSQPPATDPSKTPAASSSFRSSLGQQPQQPGTTTHSFSFGRSSQASNLSFDKSQSSSPNVLGSLLQSNQRATAVAPPAPWSDAKIGNMLSSTPRAGPPGLPNLSELQSTAAAEASARIMPPQYDVSDLRAALLNALEQNKRRKREMEQQRAAQQTAASQRLPQAPISVEKMESRPSWRNDEEYSRNLSAQYRKRRDQQEMAREEARQASRRLRGGMDDARKRPMMSRQQQQQQQQQSSRLVPGSVVQLPDRSMDVSELSQFYQVKVVRLTTVLKSLGENPEAPNFKIDLDLMELVAMELGYQPVRPARRRGRAVESDDRGTLLQRRAFSEVVETSEIYQSFPSRPPVVCIMGHVDHGKTTLMDSLRRRSRQAMMAGAASSNNNKGKKDSTAKGDVAGTEAGGITQSISAFQIKLESDPSTAVTFLDTPGHAAFRAMRESGSQAADVMVLVIAADDGVSKQSVEIINSYKSLVKEVGPSGISLVIALNKIDKDGIDVEESKARIMNQLLEHDIVTEDVGHAGESEYGPPVQLVPVSGLTGLGLDELIESLALQSEIMDLRADVEARAEGLVMEASVDQGLGVTAHCVVRWGSLQRGDVVVSGTCWGKVKVLKDVHDAALDKALPSQPIQIVGFGSLPKAGDPFVCVASEEMAKQLTERRKTMQITKTQAAATPDVKYVNPVEEVETGRRRQRKGPQPSQVELVDDDGSIRVPIMVKADTDATLAAVRESLQGLVDESSHNIVLDWVNAGVGPITSAEVRIAKQAGASIFTFGLGKRKNEIKKILDAERVEVRDHSIIYALMDDAKKAIAKHLPPIVEDVVHGKARVQAIFDIKGSHVAGLKIMDGKMFKEKMTMHGSSLPCHYRVFRGGERVTPEEELIKAASLKIIKDDVVEVKKGDECGLILEDFDDVHVDDVIECFSTRISHVFG